MDENINVAEILKDKPEGTKLWTDMFGSVTLYVVTDACDAFQVKHHNKEPWFDKDGKLCKEGVLCIYPSKSMRDWSKFAWKKGDVLVNSRGLKILFDRWANDNYTSFYAKTINLVEDGFLDTNLHTLASEEEAKSFIKCIEEKLGGKLNRETLKIEKAQSEFKDGDIVTQGVLKGVNVCIIKNCIDKIDNKYNYYARYNTQDKEINYDDWSHISPFAKFATDSEKQQLFNALAKKGKAWDAKKKMIVDLKPKYEFKPMDLCLMKYIGQYNNRGWELCQYAYTEHRVSSSGEQRDFYHAVGGEIYAECIPYKGNEHLLGTKKSK